MKLENLPVKIDCYAWKENKEKDPKVHIGYILTSLRNIPVLSVAKACEVKPRWQRIIGLGKDWRAYHPELLMNIMITDKAYLSTNRETNLPASSAVIEKFDPEDSIIIEENPKETCMLTSQQGLFIRLLEEEGLVQVGGIDICCDIFIVKVLMKNIKHLDSIATDSETTSNRSIHDFYVSYTLLGNTNIRSLERKFNRTHQLQEKVSINFRSSLASLKEYFEKVFYIPVEIFVNSRCLGSLDIRVNIPKEALDLENFLQKFPKGFEYDDVIAVKNFKPEKSPQATPPTMEIKVSIEYKSTQKLHQNEVLETHKKAKPFYYDQQGGGDFLPVISEHLNNEHEHDVEEQEKDLNQEPKDGGKLTKCQSKASNIDCILNTHEKGQMSDLPRLFSYNLQLKSVKLNRKPPRGIYQLSFFHERADIPRIFMNKDIKDEDCDDENNIINFNDIELRLYFTSLTSNIMKVIKSTSMCLLCIKGPQNTHIKANLDCKSLMITNKEKVSGNILFKNQKECVTAMAEIFVYLEDVGINLNANLKATNLDSFSENIHEDSYPVNENLFVGKCSIEEKNAILFDEEIAYKMIKELEEFKEREQDLFLQDLKKKEIMYLKEFKETFWKSKQIYLQELAEKSEKLTTITKTLEETQKSVALKNEMEERAVLDIQAIKQDLEAAYKNQLVVIKTRAKQLEDDLFHELKLKEIKIDELTQCNNNLMRENSELKETIEKLKLDYELKNSHSISVFEHNHALQEVVSKLIYFLIFIT